MILFSLISLALAAPPIITVDHDNISVNESCTLRFIDQPIIDEDNNGVVQIINDGADDPIEVQCEGRLIGAAPGAMPDEYKGIGISITGPNVMLFHAKVSGFKVGIRAKYADHFTIADADVSDNFRQRLKSTPEAEDPSDWLWPHANDDHEWINNYGAGIAIEHSEGVTVRDCYARHVQNALILDRVNHAKIYDNDFSFLSGWGIALWRSSDNTISRNALDFCVRGYSHGKYNRGQDSAGLLMFEQCCRNIVLDNSMTHCGDGIFAFAGKEALGEVNPRPRDEWDWYKDRGNSDNIFARNDLSYCAAHGLELTFSSGNGIYKNRIVGNAICGIWGGYSSRTIIESNEIAENGDAGYGQERGGINIEHGVNNRICINDFSKNRCGIFLWWDDDEAIASLPWAKVNDIRSADYKILFNKFKHDDIAIQLRRTTNTIIDQMNPIGVGEEVNQDDESEPTCLQRTGSYSYTYSYPAIVGLPAHRDSPVGKRDELRGRDNIIMTEWGPYDWREPKIVRSATTYDDEKNTATVSYRLLGDTESVRGLRVSTSANMKNTGEVSGLQALMDNDDHTMTVTFDRPDVYRIAFGWKTADSDVEQYLVDHFTFMDWSIQWFQSPCDPREDVETWRAAAKDAEIVHKPVLHELYKNGGPNDAIGNDRFGTIATTTLTIPPGDYRLRTTSDDGIRVWMNDELIIDDWTWHAPMDNDYDFGVNKPTEITLRVEHFELDGFAVLRVDLEPQQ